jgi:hypothetical protein
MQNVLNPLVTMYQTQLEASRRFADAVFSGTEKLDRVMIGATHRAFNDQLKFAQALANMRDPRNVGATLQSGFLNRTPEEAASYQKELMQIFADMQNDIGRSLQECLAQFSGGQQGGVESAVQAQEQATDAVFNPVSSMFTVWESAFKEVAALAKRNMMAAHSSVDQATANSRYASAAATSAMRRGVDEVEEAVTSTTGAMKHAGENGSDDKRGGGKRK